METSPSKSWNWWNQQVKYVFTITASLGQWQLHTKNVSDWPTSFASDGKTCVLRMRKLSLKSREWNTERNYEPKLGERKAIYANKTTFQRFPRLKQQDKGSFASLLNKTRSTKAKTEESLTCRNQKKIAEKHVSDRRWNEATLTGDHPVRSRHMFEEIHLCETISTLLQVAVPLWRIWSVVLAKCL